MADIEDPLSHIRQLAKEHIDSTDPWQRLAVAKVLSGTDPEQSMRILIEILEDEGPAGAEALRVLASSREPELLQLVIPKMYRLTTLERAALIRQVHMSGDRSVLDALVSTLDDPSLLVRLEAIEALASVRSIDTRHPYERAVARATLGDIRTLEGLPDLAAHVDERIEMRTCTATVRHRIDHLTSRVCAQLYLASLLRCEGNWM